MATTKKATRTISLEPDAEAASDHLAVAPEADAEAADSAAVCPSCGELLAWHEATCVAPAATGVEEPSPAVIFRPAAAAFAYDLGQSVQPPTQERAYRIIWRGQMKERNLETGWLYRVNVYRLDDGYWDCYREEELHAATHLGASAATAA